MAEVAEVKETVTETPAEPMDVFAEAFAQITADEPKKEVVQPDAKSTIPSDRKSVV